MNFPNPSELVNRYYGMRHGTSRPNIQGVIVSSLEAGVSEENGLTSAGRQEAVESARDSDLTRDTLIFSGYFGSFVYA